MADLGTLQFVDDVLKTLAWPVAAVIAVVLFRKQIVEKLPQVSEFAVPGGLNVKFSNVLNETKNIGNEALKKQNAQPMGENMFTPDDPIYLSAKADP